MKDSGVAWIGEIPEGWSVARLKDIKSSDRYAIVDGPFGTAISTEDYVDDGVPLVRILNLGNPNVTNQNLMHITEEHALTVQRSRFGIDDIIFAKTGATIGKCAINDSIEYGILSSSCVKISIDPRFSNKFFYYLFLTDQFNTALRLACVGTTRDTINLSPFSCLPCAFPSKTQQSRIAAYLDRRCAEIDRVMEQTRATIEEYKKLKQSIITEAVTRGIRPGRKMKDSGNNEMGMIPTDWQIIQLKYLMIAIVDCPHETPDYSSNGEYLVIRTADQDYAKLRPDDDMYRLGKTEYEKRIRRLSLDADDIVYGREGERWGLASRVPQSGKYCLGQRMMQFRCDISSITPQFAVFALSSMHVRRQGEFDTFGSTSPHVNISTIRNYSIPTPTIIEQSEIVSYLDRRCTEIDHLIVAKQQLLTQLEAYKKSVIYEYVTGKKEVPA